MNLALGGALGFQPGSSFKTFVLTAAFEQGIGPDTAVDAPARFRIPDCDGADCFLGNYSDGQGYGRMTLRKATASSINTVFAQLITDVGIQKTAEMANRLGVTSIDPNGDYGVSLSLGAAEVSPLDMASAYATLANQGVRIDPTPILRVLDRDGHILEDNNHRQGTRAVSANVAANVTNVLQDVVKSGTGTAAALDRPVAGKTGTAEEYRAAWFVGYTPQLVDLGVDGLHRRPALAARHNRRQHAGADLGGLHAAGHEGPPGAGLPAAGQARRRDPATGRRPAGAAPAASTGPTAPTAPPDTTVKAPPQATPSDTPTDCGGPCQLYSGPLDLPLTIQNTAGSRPGAASPVRTVGRWSCTTRHEPHRVT